MAIEKADAQMIAQEIAKALKVGGGGFSSAPSSTPSSSVKGAIGEAASKALSDIGSSGKAAGTSLLDFAGKLVNGGARLSDVTEILEKNFKTASFEGGLITKALGGATVVLNDLAKYVDEGVDSFRELSKTGASFGNSIIELRNNAANTRMSLADYGEVIKNNSQLFTTFGGSVNTGVKRFNELSKAFFDSPVSDELRLMGYTTKDLNEILAIQVTTQRTAGKLTDEQMKKEVEAAKSLAMEMDAVAKLTGQSRKEQEEKLRKDRENGQMMAAIDMAIAEGGADVQKSFDQMTTAAAAGGKDFQRLQQEIFAMGRPSEEMAAKFAMIGGDAQKLMMQAAEAAKNGQTEQAKLLTQQAAAAAAQTATSKTSAGLAAQGNKDFGDLYIGMRKYKMQLDEVAKAEGLDLDKAEDRIKAQEKLNQQIKDSQKVEGDAATQSAILTQARTEDMYAAINNSLVKPISQEVAPALKGFADSLKKAQQEGGGARQQAEDKINQAINAGKSLIEAGDRRRDRTAPGPEASPTLSEQDKARAKTEADKANEYRNRIKRQGGSLDMTGKLFENWGSGTEVELHGMEGVMRPEDIERIVGSSLGAVKKSVGEITSGIDISKISKDIGTSISSIMPQMSKADQVQSKIFEQLSAELTGSFDTFGDDLEGALNDVASDISDSGMEIGSEMPKIDLNALNLPGFGTNIKTAAAAVAPAMVKQPAPGKKINPETGEEYSAVGESGGKKEVKLTDAKSAGAGKTASLDDVVKELSQLNNKIAALTEETKQIGSKQERATRSNNQNVYQR